MTRTQFKYTIDQIGIRYAARTAMQDGIRIAVIQLWLSQLGYGHNKKTAKA